MSQLLKNVKLFLIGASYGSSTFMIIHFLNDFWIVNTLLIYTLIIIFGLCCVLFSYCIRVINRNRENPISSLGQEFLRKFIGFTVAINSIASYLIVSSIGFDDIHFLIINVWIVTGLLFIIEQKPQKS